MPVELGNITLDRLTEVAVRERPRIVHHAVPGLEGDLSQTLGRSSVEVRLCGIFYGPDATDNLDALRRLYLGREPVDFFAEAVGEGYFAQVLIADLDVWQRAGRTGQLDYVCRVVEYVEPPEPAAVDSLGGIDTELLDEAAGFVDDVQNALEEVSQLTDLLAGAPSFGDPTAELTALPEDFVNLTGGESTVSALTGLRDLF